MNFGLYFNLGLSHITDLNGYDHILFIIAICAAYRIRQWKSVAILITAFTIGHSIALALATLGVIPVYSELIEFLIPVTILISCVHNISYPPTNNTTLNVPIKSQISKYAAVVFFGLIHGMGFSNFLKETLVANESIFSPLLAFNLGLELGQLLIVFIIFLVNFVFLDFLSKQHRDWNLFVSGAVAGISVLLIIEKSAILFNS